MEDDPIERAEAVSERTGVPKKTLAEWRCKGVGPAYLKLENGRIRYRRSDVEAWLNSQRVVPAGR